MRNRTFKRYLKQNPALKKWILTNGQFFESNPELMRSMLENPEILNAFNQALLRKRTRLYKRINRVERRHNRQNRKVAFHSAKPAPRKFPLRFPSLSAMNQKLSQTNELLDSLHGIMDKVNNQKNLLN